MYKNILTVNTTISKFHECVVKADTTSSGTIMLSPMELIVDQPINIGCYHMDSGEQEVQFTSIQDCLVHCKNNQMRFALMISGIQCSCLPEIDHDNFEELPFGKCNFPCSDYPSLKCGGSDEVSLYTAGE